MLKPTCFEENKIYYYLPIVVFLLSLLFFKIFVKDSETKEEAERKEKMSKEVFERYKEENEEFFFNS